MRKTTFFYLLLFLTSLVTAGCEIADNGTSSDMEYQSPGRQVYSGVWKHGDKTMETALCTFYNNQIAFSSFNTQFLFQQVGTDKFTYPISEYVGSTVTLDCMRQGISDANDYYTINDTVVTVGGFYDNSALPELTMVAEPRLDLHLHGSVFYVTRSPATLTAIIRISQIDYNPDGKAVESRKLSEPIEMQFVGK